MVDERVDKMVDREVDDGHWIDTLKHKCGWLAGWLAGEEDSIQMDGCRVMKRCGKVYGKVEEKLYGSVIGRISGRWMARRKDVPLDKWMEGGGKDATAL